MGKKDKEEKDEKGEKPEGLKIIERQGKDNLIVKAAREQLHGKGSKN